MGKKAFPRRLPDNAAEASIRSLRSSTQKLNLVADLIRRRPVDQAMDQLTLSKRRVAGEVKKVLKAAVANAENNHGLDVDSLYVSAVEVGKSFVLKRFMPRAKGRGVRILKQFSRLTIVVSDVGARE